MSNKADCSKAERTNRNQSLNKLMHEIATIKEKLFALDDPTDFDRYGAYHKRLDELVNQYMRLRRGKQKSE